MAMRSKYGVRIYAGGNAQFLRRDFLECVSWRRVEHEKERLVAERGDLVGIGRRRLNVIAGR